MDGISAINAARATAQQRFQVQIDKAADASDRQQELNENAAARRRDRVSISQEARERAAQARRDA